MRLRLIFKGRADLQPGTRRCTLNDIDQLNRAQASQNWQDLFVHHDINDEFR